MKNARKTILIILAVIVVLAGAGGIGYDYWYQGNHFVTTDNAEVTAPMTAVVAPASGKLMDFSAQMGAKVTEGERLGVIQNVPGAGSVKVTATRSGVIGEVMTSNGSLVAQGTPVASVVDTGSLTVTANVPETDIAKVKIGQTVDISLTAYPNVTFKGRVAGISPATASIFSLLPQNNTNSTFTPVTQVIPVRITFDRAPGEGVRPGESATVQIDIR